MTNEEIARLFHELGELSQLAGELKFKSLTYHKAANIIEHMEESATPENVVKENGIGKAIANKLQEILETGTCDKLTKFRKKFKHLLPLMDIPGIGPATARNLNQQYKVKTVEDVRRLVRNGTITSKPIVEGVSRINLNDNHRIPWDEADTIARKIIDSLNAQVGDKINRMEVCGSYRRKSDTIGDLDIVIETNHIGEVSVAARQLFDVLMADTTCKIDGTIDGVHVDIKLTDENSYGAMILYFTGDKDVNIMMRRKAWKYGWKLNEYGLWNGDSWSPNHGEFPKDRFVAGKTEKEVFNQLGFVYLNPEDRQRNNLVEKAEQQVLF